MYVLSRKIIHAIRRNLEALQSGQFAEREVKELLIDVRELAKYVRPRIADGDPKFISSYDQFIDVCDCIAHANRIKGLIERNIRAYMQKLYANIHTLNFSQFEKLPVEDVLTGDSIVAALLATIHLSMSTYDGAFKPEAMEPVLVNRDDIALCVISLLQDSTIELKEDEGNAMLHVLTHEHKYHLYCRVLNSLIQREARERTGGTGIVFFNFPVIITNAKCTDSDELSAGPDLPKIIEVHRIQNGLLRVKIIEQAN
jgi:hypothetical protein